MGHYMKNSKYLVLSQLATWRLNGTIIPLYDTLGIEAIKYAISLFHYLSHICNECELKTILCSPESARIILQNVRETPAQYVCLKNIIIVMASI